MESDPASGVRMASQLTRFWRQTGLRAEGIQWMERGLQLAPRTDPADRARALVGLAVLSDTQGSGCREQLEEALRIYRRIGDGSGTGHALRMLGFYYSLRRDGDRAMSLY